MVNRCEPYLCKCQHIVHIQYSVLWFVILPNMSKYNGHHNTQLSIEFTWKLAFQWCEEGGCLWPIPSQIRNGGNASAFSKQKRQASINHILIYWHWLQKGKQNPAIPSLWISYAPARCPVLRQQSLCSTWKGRSMAMEDSASADQLAVYPCDPCAVINLNWGTWPTCPTWPTWPTWPSDGRIQLHAPALRNWSRPPVESFRSILDGQERDSYASW